MFKKGVLFIKLLLSIIFFTSLLFLLSGCWDRVEVNDLAIVTAAAIDNKEKNIEISLQIFIPKSISSGGQGGGGGGGASGNPVTMVVSQSGINLADALSKLQADLPRKIFWGQCKVFIFGEKRAKEGILDELDFLLRQPEPRERSYVFVSKGKAKEILELQPNLERDSADTIKEIVEFDSGIKVTLKDLDEMLNGDAQTAILPYLKIATEKIKKKSYPYPKITGSAIFKKDKMIGDISVKETRGILWLRNEIKNYTVTIEGKNRKGILSIYPVTAKVDLTPYIRGENWIMKIKIETEGTVIQNNTNFNLANPNDLKLVEKALTDEIKKRIELVLPKIQNELEADVVGFAKKFHRKYPKQWNKVSQHWDEVFPNIKLNYDFKGHIRREGYITKPTKLTVEEGD
ncbi:Ger(x)C family spore germination protein [Cytobacillus depressus]|uniref:Ger(X)C family spore germination protein n=1 Tax=Cytobacillus depressus TaxID=1602942 RepID=A0A6L3VDA4_9BACI|nr:Ger(x)C family spore germination protein [Cytobacillus depressus]KAB2337271.1 Ger(x)C family spore germination protein [Cytobacillus depressus]